MLYYTQHAFCLWYILWHGGRAYQKTGSTFSTQKTRGKIIVPHVVKLRHAKVVVSGQYPRKKPVSGMHSSRYRIVWCFFPPRRFGEINIGGVWMACFVVAVVPDSVAVVGCLSSESGRVGTYLTMLLRTWRAPFCWLLIDHLSLWVSFFLAHFYFPASGHTSLDLRCRPSRPPRLLA